MHQGHRESFGDQRRLDALKAAKTNIRLAAKQNRREAKTFDDPAELVATPKRTFWPALWERHREPSRVIIDEPQAFDVAEVEIHSRSHSHQIFVLSKKISTKNSFKVIQG